VSATTLCVTDDAGETVVLNTDSDFAAGAIVGLHGWLSAGAVTIPMHGTALVDSAGTSVKIGIQGINNVRRQYIGIAIVTDLMLNGSGTFENVNSTRPFDIVEIPVTWTALDVCPGPPFTPSGKDGNVPSGDGTIVPPRTPSKK
jgi:hypothetical protein